MRNFDFAYAPLRHRQRGAGGEAVVPVGDILWNPTLPGVNYEDAAAVSAASPLTVAGYPDLFAAQGLVINKIAAQHPQTAEVMGCLSSVVFDGAIYGITNAGGVKKRATALGSYGAVLWTPAPAPAASRLLVGPTRMLVTWQNSTNCWIELVRPGEIRAGAVLAVGNPNLPMRMLEVGPGVILCTRNVTGSILRTANDGVSWQSITTNLASTQWLEMWKGAGANIHMLGANGNMVTSTDQGATWGAPFTPPAAAAPSTATAGSNLIPATGICVAARRGAFLTTAGLVKSFDLDNPAAGLTDALAAGTVGASSPFWATKAGFWFSSQVAAPMAGVWFAPGGTPAAWRQVFAAAAFPGTFVFAGWSDWIGLEPGDGRITLDLANSGASAPTNPGAIQLADGVATFDRYLLTDPGLVNGQRPYVRLK